MLTLSLKIVKVRPKDKEWMTGHIHYLINRRDRLYRKYKKSKSENNHILLKQPQVEVCTAIDIAKSAYFSKLTARMSDPETAPKAYHQLCKRVLFGQSRAAIPPLIDRGKVLSDSESKSNLLNDFFSQNSNLDPEPKGFALLSVQVRPHPHLRTIEFTPTKVYTVLKELKINKANGPNNISNRILKETSEVMAVPLSKLFNKILISGFPRIWKKKSQCHSDTQKNLISKVKKIIVRYLSLAV